MEQPGERNHTYADLENLPENVRAELIYGELYMMAPPSRIHQKILFELSLQIGNFLDDKPCELYPAPFSVRPFDDDDSIFNSTTEVQPDISVICDHSKLDEKGCKGAPDFVIEILSPSNARHDRFVKLNLYARARVREYWIVDPRESTVEVLLLDENGKLTIAEMYTRDDIAKVTVLPGCGIDLSRVFPEIEVPQNKKK